MTGTAFRGGVADALLITVLAIIAIVVFYKLWDKLTPFNDGEELYIKGNTAYAIQRGGVILGQAFAMVAAVSTYDSGNMLAACIWLVAEFAYIIAALLVTRVVLNKLVLPGVSNTSLVLRGEMSVGVMEAAFYVATGLLLNGSLTGTAATIGLTVGSSVVFFLLGLVLLVCYWWVYELVTPGNSIRARLIEGKTGAGVEAAGVLIAAGIIVRNGVAGDFTSWANDIGAFVATSGIGLVLMIIAQLLLNRFGPGRGMKSARNNDNLSHHIVLAMMLVGIASVVAATVYVAF